MDTEDNFTTGPKPVTWMYGAYREEPHASVKRWPTGVVEAQCWTETPLSPTSLVTDLLEALREARDQLWHLAKDPNNNPLLRQIDAAIAKAEGRS